MEKETWTKEEHYKAIVEQEKKVKISAVNFAEENIALGKSDFAEGYNTAIKHFMAYLRK